MIARMWETRIREGEIDDFCSWVQKTAWPQFLAAPGFGGGELYRSDEQGRAVMVTRWATTAALSAGIEWFDLGAERFVAREPEAWEFTPVELG